MTKTIPSTSEQSYEDRKVEGRKTEGSTKTELSVGNKKRTKSRCYVGGVKSDGNLLQSLYSPGMRIRNFCIEPSKALHGFGRDSS